MEANLRRADTDAEHLGDLGVRVTFDLFQHDDRAERRRQRSKRGLEIDVLGGRRWPVYRLIVNRRLGGSPPPSSPGERRARGQPHEPGFELATLFVSPQGTG